jgi:hypothetical protein
MLKRVAPPPSDEQLFAAEQTDNIRRRDREAEIADQQEQERLVLAGEPESEARAAVRASASVLESRPMQEEEKEDAETKPAEDRSDHGADNPPVSRRKIKRPRRIITEPAWEPPLLPQKITTEEIIEPENRDRDERLAYRLMDLAYKKWAKGAEKDLNKANRALAIDLGKDTALYLRSGIIRMNDIHSTIEKLTAASKAGKDGGDDEENLDDDLEELRQQLRGK